MIRMVYVEIGITGANMPIQHNSSKLDCYNEGITTKMPVNKFGRSYFNIKSTLSLYSYHYEGFFLSYTSNKPY